MDSLDTSTSLGSPNFWFIILTEEELPCLTSLLPVRMMLPSSTLMSMSSGSKSWTKGLSQEVREFKGLQSQQHMPALCGKVCYSACIELLWLTAAVHYTYLYVDLNSEDSIAELHGGGLGGGGLGHATPSILQGKEGVKQGATRPIWVTGRTSYTAVSHWALQELP